MRAALVQLITVVMAVVAFRGDGAQATNEVPLILVQQFRDDGVGSGVPYSRFPGGLVAALWSDGRMVRATGSNTIGKSYVEGMVGWADLEKFFAYFEVHSNPTNQHVPIELHAAYLWVKVERDGKKSGWTRPVPDVGEDADKLQGRLWSLPLQEQRPMEWDAVVRSRWYKVY